LLLQVTDSTRARRLRETKTSVLDFMGNFQTSAACVTRDMATKSLSTIGIAINLNFYFESPCGAIVVEVRIRIISSGSIEGRPSVLFPFGVPHEVFAGFVC
jgi:hypothetical protein